MSNVPINLFIKNKPIYENLKYFFKNKNNPFNLFNRNIRFLNMSNDPIN